jgi:hypothetical protein
MPKYTGMSGGDLLTSVATERRRNTRPQRQKCGTIPSSVQLQRGSEGCWVIFHAKRSRKNEHCYYCTRNSAPTPFHAVRRDARILHSSCLVPQRQTSYRQAHQDQHILEDMAALSPRFILVSTHRGRVLLQAFPRNYRLFSKSRNSLARLRDIYV